MDKIHHLTNHPFMSENFLCNDSNEVEGTDEREKINARNLEINEKINGNDGFSSLKEDKNVIESQNFSFRGEGLNEASEGTDPREKIIQAIWNVIKVREKMRKRMDPMKE